MIEELRNDSAQQRLLRALERAAEIAEVKRELERQRRIQASVDALFSRASTQPHANRYD